MPLFAIYATFLPFMPLFAIYATFCHLCHFLPFMPLFAIFAGQSPGVAKTIFCHFCRPPFLPVGEEP
jgi:hypothetical protein